MSFDNDATASPDSQAQPEQERGAAQPTRLAEGWFENVRDRDEHGERRGHHRRHWDEDDDDDDDHARGHSGRHGHHSRDHHGRDGGGERGGDLRADPNDANAPVPDNGVFNNKTRPKVEVQ